MDYTNLTIRLPVETMRRVDGLARYLGLGRSAYVRLTLAYADALVTLGELAEREQTAGRLDATQSEVRRAASADVARLSEQLKRPLSPSMAALN